MRQTTPEKQIASLIGELGSEFMRAVAKSDTMPKVFVDSEALHNAQAIEHNHRRENRRYDSDLRVIGNCNWYKMREQQIATYGWDNVYTAEELNADITNPQPSREQFAEEVRRNMKSKENMMEKLFHIGFIEGTDSNHEIFSKQPCTAGNKITLLKRLWNCPHDKMGSVAVNALGGAIQHWEAIYAAEVGDVPQEDDDVPQVVRFRGNTFAQQMHQLGWIVIPAMCWTVETLPSHARRSREVGGYLINLMKSIP